MTMRDARWRISVWDGKCGYLYDWKP
jgi:hypothetical protein